MDREPGRRRHGAASHITEREAVGDDAAAPEGPDPMPRRRHRLPDGRGDAPGPRLAGDRHSPEQDVPMSWKDYWWPAGLWIALAAIAIDLALLLHGCGSRH